MTDDPNFIPARPRQPGDVPPPPPPKTRIAKDMIWRRATDDEAAQMQAALASQPLRLQQIYDGASWIETTDELFGVMNAALTQLFGADRAAQLLEPTD